MYGYSRNEHRPGIQYIYHWLEKNMPSYLYILIQILKKNNAEYDRFIWTEYKAIVFFILKLSTLEELKFLKVI